MGARVNLIFGIELLPVEPYLKLEYTEVFEKMDDLLQSTPYVYDSTGDGEYTDQIVIGLKVPEINEENIINEATTLDEVMEVAAQMHEFVEQQTPKLQEVTLKELNELKAKVYKIMEDEDVNFTPVEDASELKVLRTTLTWEE
jgi:hypothetical protein